MGCVTFVGKCLLFTGGELGFVVSDFEFGRGMLYSTGA